LKVPADGVLLTNRNHAVQDYSERTNDKSVPVIPVQALYPAQKELVWGRK